MSKRKMASIALVPLLCVFVACAVGLAACGGVNGSTFKVIAESKSYIVAVAENGASDTAEATLEVGELDDISVECDISAGSIQVVVSDEEGNQLFNEKLQGRRTAQITPTLSSDIYTVVFLAGDATGTVEIFTTQLERGMDMSDNSNVTELSGGNANANEGWTSISGGSDTTDELFARHQDNAEFYVFGFDGQTLSVIGCEEVSMGGVEDDGFYRVVADATFLNGGVAGYKNHPEIDKLHSVEKISPDELAFPKLSGKSYYGITEIGDYAEGDYLLFAFAYVKGVWKDDKWVYRYRESFTLDDGRTVLVSDEKKVDEASVKAGMANGVLSCEDYFVLPAKEN